MALGLVGLMIYAAGAYLCAGGLLRLIWYGDLLAPLELVASFRAEGIPLLIGGVVVVACAVTGQIVLARCQSCRRRLDRVCFTDGRLWSIASALRVCPYCSTSLDSSPSTS
jgi:hypothetical protein